MVIQISIYPGRWRMAKWLFHWALGTPREHRSTESGTDSPTTRTHTNSSGRIQVDAARREGLRRPSDTRKINLQVGRYRRAVLWLWCVHALTWTTYLDAVALTESPRDRRADFPTLEITLTLDADALAQGTTGQGQIRLHNAGRGQIEFQSDQPLVAAVLDPLSQERVGGFAGWLAGTGLVVKLSEGESSTIPVLVGTFRKEHDEVSPLSPGEYLVSADIPIYEFRPDGEGYERSHLRSPQVRLRVV